MSLMMALRNVDCQYQRSLRARPFERPKPLRRGQGVGGGNYRQLPQGIGTARPTAQRQGRPDGGSRPASSSSSRPATSSSSGTSSCPKIEEIMSRPSTSKAQLLSRLSAASSSRIGECQPGPSAMSQAGSSRSAVYGSKRPRTTEPGTSKSRTSVTCPPETGRTRNVTAPPSKGRRSERGSANRSYSLPRNPLPRSVSSTGSVASRPRSSMTLSSPKPGPSCLRPPPATGVKRRVQFTGVPQQGPGPSPDSRTRYKYLTAAKVRAAREGRNGTDDTCEPSARPSPAEPYAPAYGPSLYPIYPGQYEVPFVTMPGPRQVLLMPGDIDPNETTVIDIVGLTEGDIEEVPGIPPQAPASLLEDAWNEYMRQAVAEDLKRRKDEARNEKKVPTSTVRGKKKQEEQMCYLPSFSHLNYIHQGRAFSFEEHGNVRVDDPINPPYQGPSFRAPDPECQRARPFTYKDRKTSVRPYTDEERREMQEAEAYRTIRAIINQHDAKWESDRASRGVTDDDLIDIDAEACSPRGNIRSAPSDIFSATDDCGFGESYIWQSPAFSPPPQASDPCDDLITWDEGASMQSSAVCNGSDILTLTPPRSPKRLRASSPNLMGMCEPEVDLLGIRTPPRCKSPSPTPKCNRDDLIQWGAAQSSLPFDEGIEESFFDTVTRPSPETAGPRTPSTRIIRVVPMENNPCTAVLENSPLASRGQQDAFRPAMEPMDENDSLGILDYENIRQDVTQPWQRLGNLEEDFHQTFSGNPRFSPNMSGVVPLEGCDDQDSLGILDDDCLSDLEFSVEADARLRSDTKFQTLFQPLAEGAQLLDDETCPFDGEFQELERQFEEERADLLNLRHQVQASPACRREFGRLGSELLEQCQDPVELCSDLLGLTEPPRRTPPKRMGPFARELIESCPEEQLLVDVSDATQAQQPTRPSKFSYSRDLFTNVQWDPSMACKPLTPPEDPCP